MALRELGNGRLLLLGGLFLALVLGAACYKVPVTGRTQFNMFSASHENRLGADAFRSIIGKEKLSRNRDYIAAVKRVGDRIAAVSHAAGFEWRYYAVIENDETVNAFALPGGKIGVYTGMLPVARTDAGLATVMAHEVAHAVARHGGERMSLGVLVQLGADAISRGLRNGDPTVTSGVLQAYGIGTALAGTLPFNRKQETEADRIGLIYMAKAGYDPREAVPFWERMGRAAAAGGGGAPPEFLSTHPGYRTRIANMRRWMPEAMEHYRAARRAPERTIPLSGRLRGR